MIIEVKQGKLEGTTNKSVYSGKEYYSFLGIPYAKPPVGDLRFRPAEPLEKWNGILDAKKEGSPCIQFDWDVQKTRGSEDCLYLNVFTPAPPSEIKTPKAVMVFIHGGGFMCGSGSPNSHSPDYLINYDVVYATLNYRLHALGFLNMGVSGCAGNCGLKDQLLALKWIKENIGQFGGDCENITIFGESAGASSVHLHMISPLSKGFFNKAILQSGHALCSWTLTDDPKEMGYRLGKKLGFQERDPEKLVEFLRKQSVDSIYKAVGDIHEDLKKDFPGKSTTLPFAPSIEFIKENAFVSDSIENLLKTAQPVPLIIGLNDKEGRLLYAALSRNIFQMLKDDFTLAVKYNVQCHPSTLKELSDKVKQFYFGDKEVGEETSELLVDLYTDLFFRNFYESFDYITNSTFPVYVYEFSFSGKFNTFSNIFNKNITTGAAHADELGYLFCRRLGTNQIEDPERTVINNMCTMWTNFAKTGNPTHELANLEWKSHTATNPFYLRIDTDLALVKRMVLEERFAFWRNIFQMAKESSTS